MGGIGSVRFKSDGKASKAMTMVHWELVKLYVLGYLRILKLIPGESIQILDKQFKEQKCGMQWREEADVRELGELA